MNYIDGIHCRKKDCVHMCFGKCFINEEPGVGNVQIKWVKGDELVTAKLCNYYESSRGRYCDVRV